MPTPPSSPKTERKVDEESSQESLEQSSEEKVEQRSEQAREPIAQAEQSEQTEPRVTPPQNPLRRSPNTLFGFTPGVTLVARCTDHVHVVCPHGHEHVLSNEQYESLALGLSLPPELQFFLALAVAQSMLEEVSVEEEKTETLDETPPSVSQAEHSHEEEEEESTSSCRMS